MFLVLLNLIQKSWKEEKCTTPYQDPGGLKIWWQVPEKWRIWMNCPNENNWLKAKVQPSWEISILCPNFRFRPKLRKSYRQVKESSQLKRELGNFLKSWDKNVKSGVVFVPGLEAGEVFLKKNRGQMSYHIFA